mmetsp:Transcript_117632/g.213921  ORF Transcript_117632/g.213921 Transcript_117632/m.213921 type:complete len:99 (-) Transcript_117632:52-348(-)
MNNLNNLHVLLWSTRHLNEILVRTCPRRLILHRGLRPIRPDKTAQLIPDAFGAGRGREAYVDISQDHRNPNKDNHNTQRAEAMSSLPPIFGVSTIADL